VISLMRRERRVGKRLGRIFDFSFGWRGIRQPEQPRQRFCLRARPYVDASRDVSCLISRLAPSKDYCGRCG
jgi:hypothetical protein